jgi:hexosaminidase
VNYSNAYFEVTDSVLNAPTYNGLEWKFSKPRIKDHFVWSAIKYPFMWHHMNNFRPNNDSLLNILDIKPGDSTVLQYFVADKIYNKTDGWKWSKVHSKVFTRTIHFNKATGKQVITSVTPSPSYPGNGGAFGLVNGVRADKFNSTEWLGWSGKEVEIAIDLDETDSIKEVVLHVWKQEPSWIYLPASIEVLFDPEPGSGLERRWANSVHEPAAGWPDPRKITIPVKSTTARFVYIRLKPVMQIPEGRQGAGKPAWIFLDEVEIN